MNKSLFTQGPVRGSEAFEQAWEVYPDRHVAENKRDALRQWLRRIREGVHELEMVEGARRYRTYCDRLRLSSTEYVMQPRRFFGPSRHFELPWQIQGGRIFAEHQKNTATMQRLRNMENDRVDPIAAKAALKSIRLNLK